MKQPRALAILFVEDNRRLAPLVRDALKKDGQPAMVFWAASDLEERLFSSHTGNFDLIILDLDLPGGKGFSALERLAEQYPDTPLIALRPDGTDEIRQNAIDAGASDCLLKNELSPRDLGRAILQKLEQKLLPDKADNQKAEQANAVADLTGSLMETIGKLTEELKEKQKAEQAYRSALKELRQREKEISALLKSSRAIMTYRNFTDAARAVFDVCKELLGATAGYVALLSQDGLENELLFLEAGGRPCTVDTELPMPIRGLRAMAYETGKAVFDNDFMNSEWMEFMPEGHVTLDNVLFAPLNVDGRIEGIMGLANKPGGFDQHDAHLAAAMGEIVSIALLNSRTLDSLRESQLRFYELFDRMSSGVAIYQADPTGSRFFFKEMNYSGEKIAMASELEYLNRDVAEFFPGIKSMGLLDAFKRVWQSGEAEFLPASLYQDERFSIWLENYVYKLPGGELVNVFDDVTDKTAAQRSLSKSEERYRNLIKHCPDPVVIYDSDGKVISINPAFENIFGWGLEEIQGRRLDFIPEESMDETLRAVSKISRGEPVVNFETKRSTKYGSILDIEISGTSYRDDQGELFGFVVFLRDISPRKALETQLRKNESNLRSILNSVPAGVVMIDQATHEIEYANPVALKMIDATAEEIIGRKCHTLICPFQEADCPLSDGTQPPENTEGILLTRQGGEIPILKTVVEAQISGKKYYLDSFIDLSGVKRSQEEQLARRSLQAVMETAGAACHELNQPLQAIMNLADAAMRETAPGLPVHEDIKDILQNANKMAAVTRKLSNLTQYETTSYSEGSDILDLDKSSLK